MGRIERIGYYVGCSSYLTYQSLFNLFPLPKGLAFWNIQLDFLIHWRQYSLNNKRQLGNMLNFRWMSKSVIRNFLFSLFHPMAGRLFRTLQVLQRFHEREEHAKPLSREIPVNCAIIWLLFLCHWSKLQ